MMHVLTSCLRAIVLPLVVVTGGCAAGLGSTLGTLGTLSSIAELLSSPRQADQRPQQVELTAEVRQVDTRRQLIEVETADGRAGGVMFDLATTVVHEQRPYPITSLQPGDRVRLLLERAAHNNLYASRIAVVQLVQADTVSARALAADTAPRPAPDTVPGPPADTVPRPPADTAPAPDTLPAVRQLEGAVGEIDPERGRFQLHPQQEDPVTVSLPFNASAAMVERFNGLSEGDRVRVEIYPLSGSRGELRQFLEPVTSVPPPSP